jgi:hypothetical protein
MPLLEDLPEAVKGPCVKARVSQGGSWVFAHYEPGAEEPIIIYRKTTGNQLRTIAKMLETKAWQSIKGKDRNVLEYHNKLKPKRKRRKSWERKPEEVKEFEQA